MKRWCRSGLICLGVAGALAACSRAPETLPPDDEPGCTAGAPCQREPIHVATATFASHFVAGHPDSSATTIVDVSAGAATEWRLTASAPWIAVPADAQTGAGPASITVDASELPIGSHTGTVTAASTVDPASSATITVMADVTGPTFSVSPATLTLGGADGLEPAAGQTLQIRLGTGIRSHPWTATLVTDAGGAWLSASAAAGSASEAPVSLAVNANRPLVAPGRYTGAVRLEAAIGGYRISRTVPVYFNKEGHWLHVSSLGAAFSSFPGRSVLTRTLQVRSSQGRTDVPWTAQSDQSWLTVTPSGLTGGGLTLTANPAGLQSDQPYLARVTVSSTDGSILNQQIVRVGLRIGTAAPQSVSLASTTVTQVIANPVEPYVYTNAGGADITARDVYTGAVVRTFPGVVGTAGRMAVSSDGAILFVNDNAAYRTIALDAETGAELRRYSWGTATYPGAVAYARPNAQPIVITPGGAFAVATGQRYADGTSPGWYGGNGTLTLDPAERNVYSHNFGSSPSTLSQLRIAYSALATAPLVVKYGGATNTGSNGQDVCVSEDGARVYTASGAPYTFSVFGTANLQQVQTLPANAYPNNAACGWNGLFFGGASPGATVWIYRPDGTAVTTLTMGIGLRTDSVVLSGDNTRVAASAEGSFSVPPSFHIRTAPGP
jgi:hypothetical protein